MGDPRTMDASTPTQDLLDVDAEVDVDAARGLGPAPGLSLVAATELQDHLLVATNDLDRLQTLLTGACDMLLRRFTTASAYLEEQCTSEPEPRVQGAYDRLRDELGEAVTALQFQDMATQLIAHTSLRLRGCADAGSRAGFVASAMTQHTGAAQTEGARDDPHPAADAERRRCRRSARGEGVRPTVREIRC